MLAFELKIFILTCVYFMGWFLFERLFSAFWENVENKKCERKKQAILNMPSMGVITPLDQTSRYIRSLKHTDWKVRRISCIQLGEKRGSSVVQALIEALKDSREEVSMAASEALTKIGDPAAIAALTDHLQRLDQRVEENFERLRAA